MLDVLLLIIVLVILILVHEAGHFSVAKFSGARVEEFGFGFPPKLFGVKKGETEYTVNAIPFGGFVRIYGEDPEDAGAQASGRSFINQPKLMQAAIIAAGVVGNFLLAWLLFAGAFMAGLPMAASEIPAGARASAPQVVITSVLADSPAADAGLAVGDSIRTLEAGDDTLLEPMAGEVQSFIAEHSRSAINLVYSRDDESPSVIITPVSGITGDGRAIGIAMEDIAVVQLPIHRALWESAATTVRLTGAVATAFGTLLVNAVTGAPSLSTLTGPVGIVGIVGDAASFGLVYLVSFVALISVNLAVLNLIPFPALDGGRLLFLGIEAVKGSPVNPRFAHYAHLIGFALLILLMIIVTYNDIARLL